MRIVSLCPSNTELLAYLGLLDQLVGVDNYSDWPAGVKDLPKVGPDLDIDIAKVIELKPDLVLASLSVPGMEKNIEKLKKNGLPYIILNPQSLQDIADDLMTVGELIGIRHHAEKMVQLYQESIQYYRDWSKDKQHPNIYWEWWPKPVFSPGGTNWLTEISNLAGARNIFANTKKASIQTNWESIVKQNPDHICLAWVGVNTDKVRKSFVLDRKQANTMQAIQNDQIHILEEAYYCRPSPQLIIGLHRLANLVHSDDPPSNKYIKQFMPQQHNIVI